MPQTRFVLGKALAQGLRPILVVNKIDRPEQRAHEVVDEVFDLLVELGADDHQLDFPIVYASAKQGIASREVDGERKDLRPLLDLILEQAPPPEVDVDGTLQFQAVTLGWDEFVGRLVIGRVERGTLRRGVTVARIPAEGAPQTFRITKLFAPHGLERVERESASAGEIAIIAGVDAIEIGDTVCPPDALESLPRIAIDPPTVSVRFSVNTSPFAGQEGKYVTSRQIGDRLRREVLTNVSIKLASGEQTDTFEVSGRGELQISVLVETMRREGYEFAVSQPQIIERTIDHVRCEPVEDVVAEVPQEATGSVMEKLGARRGRLTQMESRGAAHAAELHRAQPRTVRLPHRVSHRHARRGHAVPDGARLRAVRRRAHGPRRRRHRRHRDRPVHLSRDIRHPGTRDHVHRQRRVDLRGPGRRRESPPEGHERERVPREEAHERAQHGS